MILFLAENLRRCGFHAGTASGPRAGSACHESSSRRSKERGLSLIEVLFSLLILLVITLSIVPLFSRAIQSNKRGAQSSQIVSFINGNVEEVNQVSINYEAFNAPLLDMSAVRDMWETADETSSGLTPYAIDLAPRNPCTTQHPYDTCDFYGLPTQYWVLGEVDSVQEEQDFKFFDERWMTEEEIEAADASDVGRILWLKDTLFYSYDIADIHQGTIAATNDPDSAASTVIQLGHPRLFDAPRSWNELDPPDIREVRVSIRSTFEGSPTGPGMLVTISHFRVF